MKPTIQPRRKTAHGKAVPNTDSSTKQRLFMGAGVLLLLLLLAAWYLRANSQVTKVLQMRQDFLSERDQLSPEEKKEKIEELRAEREKLSPEERDRLRQEVTKQFQKKINGEASKYLAMSPEEREKAIDERIARAEAAPPKQPRDAGAGGPDGAGGGAGPGNPDNPRGPATPEDRDTRRRESLLHLTPEARAGLDQMRLDLATRRAELGLPTSPPGRVGKGR